MNKLPVIGETGFKTMPMNTNNLSDLKMCKKIHKICEK